MLYSRKPLNIRKELTMQTYLSDTQSPLRNFSHQGILAILLVAGFMLACSSQTAAGIGGHDHAIRIGIIGDQTGTTDLNQAYIVLGEGVDALAREDLDVVIHVGDLLESSATEQEIEDQFTTATQILDTLPVDWYMTAGDHDVNPPEFEQDSDDRSREALFQELYGERVPAVLQHPYYSFDVGNYHFIALYSLEALHSDPRWGNIFLSKMSDAQLQWLRQDLKQHKNAKATVVFLHHPMWYNWSEWQRVHNLLRRYNVAAVVAGHFHYDQSEGVIDGIRYVVVGATGGSVKQGSRDAGNVQHVSVMTVDGPGKVAIKLRSLSDDDPLLLTSRRDMDKVQALDIVLGELWNFASTNPVFLKSDGSLANACDSNEPAKIQISPLGNPTDKSINVEIGFSSDDPHIVLNDPGFTAGECEQVINDFECVLARSARIFISNNSSVTVNTFAPPLWEATLGVSGATPSAGTALNFDIRLDYDGVPSPLFLDRRATTTVQACL
jgi:predicted phosphohydrolase